VRSEKSQAEFASGETLGNTFSMVTERTHTPRCINDICNLLMSEIGNFNIIITLLLLVAAPLV